MDSLLFLIISICHFIPASAVSLLLSPSDEDREIRSHKQMFVPYAGPGFVGIEYNVPNVTSFLFSIFAL
jgi:hypothetical protein